LFCLDGFADRGTKEYLKVGDVIILIYSPVWSSGNAGQFIL